MLLRSIGATTHVDRHNMKMTKEALDSAAKQINGEACPTVGLEHDVTLPPLGKTLKGTVEPTKDGEFQLIILQEIFEKVTSVKLPDGGTAIMQESEIDKRPFITESKQLDKIHLAYDIVNFSSQNEIDEFQNTIKETVDDKFFEQKNIFRKAILPDPELVIALSKGLVAYLAAKKIIEKAGDKIIDKIVDDLAKFYDLTKIAVTHFIQYAIPKNRPVTYIIDAPGMPHIQFVAVTNDPNQLLTAIIEEKLKSRFAHADELKRLFGVNKVQFILNSEGNWDFNFMLTDTGAVIGTEACFRRQARRLELLRSSISNEEGK